MITHGPMDGSEWTSKWMDERKHNNISRSDSRFHWGMRRPPTTLDNRTSTGSLMRLMRFARVVLYTGRPRPSTLDSTDYQGTSKVSHSWFGSIGFDYQGTSKVSHLVWIVGWTSDDIIAMGDHELIILLWESMTYLIIARANTRDEGIPVRDCWHERWSQ